MAETPNLKLPLISADATADIPRDMNALAEAVDTAVIEKIATSVPSIPQASLSEPGIVRLNDNINSTATDQAATANAVKKAYEQAVATAASSLPIASTTNKGIVQLIDSVNNTSKTQAATANSVKIAYDKATEAGQNYDGNIASKTITIGVGKQFSTIQAAIDSLPKYRVGEVKLNIDAGTYPEEVTFRDFAGGRIFLVGTDVDNTFVKGVRVSNCMNNIWLQGLTLTDANSRFYIERSYSVDIVFCRKITPHAGTYATAVEVEKTPRCEINNGEFSNQFTAISSSNGSILTVVGTSGTNNQIGYSATSAMIFLRTGNTLSATTMQSKYQGGQIFG